MTKIQKDLSRGLYSSFFREKPTYRKLLFLADFIENWAPFIQGDPKKMIHSVLQLKSVVKVGFNFSTGVSESEF